MLNYQLDRTFSALADPARRTIVERLAGGPATVSELAGMMSIDPPNYLYRVMATLQADGSVKKQGKGYVAT